MNGKQLEQRIEAIEKALANLKEQLSGAGRQFPWWERIAGTFHNDEAYREAMDLGQQYRRSLHPDCHQPEGE